MDWGAILAGISGGAEGAFRGYSWQKELDLNTRRLDEQTKQREADRLSREDMARFKEDQKLILADIQERLRRYMHDTPSGNVELQEEGRTDRYDRPSGNALLAEEGRTTRHFEPSGNVLEQIGAAWDRHRTPSGNATLGAETQRYGIDTRAATAERGQDLSQATTARGQDLASGDRRFTATEATNRARLRATSPYQSLFGASGSFGALPQEPATAPAPSGEVRPGAQQPVYRWSDGTTRAYPEAGQTPLTPQPSTVPPQPTTPDAAVDRDAQRRQRFEQIKSQIVERQKKGQAIDDLIKELQKLRTGGGQ